jgi:hypothetical protein
VDALHSLENKPNKVSIFPLTLILLGVQQTRSLTVSKVFRLVASPGPKQVHRSRACSALANGGAATVNSELLVEKTRSTSETR